MITSLTVEQENAKAEYVKKWIEIGLSTKTDRKKAEDNINDAYKEGGLPPPKNIIWVQSPMGIIKYYAKKEKLFLKDAWAKLPIMYGSHDAGWLSFYDFFLNECKLDGCEKLRPLINIASACGWYAVFKEACIFSDNPVECNTILNERGVRILHKDLGPAIRYGDGYSVYALNGIRVPKDIAETPADQLDPTIIQTLVNADIRREIIRKIGIKTVLEKLKAKIIDKNDNYELFLLEAGNTARPYLSMKDATTSEYYIEGVPAGITTITEALAWREGETVETYEEPILRT